MLEEWIKREERRAEDRPLHLKAEIYGVLARLHDEVSKQVERSAPTFTSVAEAAKIEGVTAQAIRDRCKRGDYRYEMRGRKMVIVDFFSSKTNVHGG